MLRLKNHSTLNSQVRLDFIKNQFVKFSEIIRSSGLRFNHINGDPISHTIEYLLLEFVLISMNFPDNVPNVRTFQDRIGLPNRTVKKPLKLNFFVHLNSTQFAIISFVSGILIQSVHCKLHTSRRRVQQSNE